MAWRAAVVGAVLWCLALGGSGVGRASHGGYHEGGYYDTCTAAPASPWHGAFGFWVQDRSCEVQV